MAQVTKSGFPVTLRQLEVFKAVVQHGSFRKCAEELGIKGVSVSQHIQELEQRLGHELFERRAGDAVRLTEDGEAALVFVDRMLEELHGLANYFDGDTSGNSEIAVTLHPFVGRVLFERLADLGDELNIAINARGVDNLGETEALHKVRNGLADMCFYIAGPGPLPLDCEQVCEEKLAFFVAPSHPLASEEVVTADMLRENRAVFLSENNPLRLSVDVALAQVGLDGIANIFETDEYGLILSLVQRGYGYACFFDCLSSAYGEHDGLVKLNTEMTAPYLNVRAATRRTFSRDIALVKLRNMLINAYRKSGGASDTGNPALGRLETRVS